MKAGTRSINNRSTQANLFRKGSLLTRIMGGKDSDESDDDSVENLKRTEGLDAQAFSAPLGVGAAAAPPKYIRVCNPVMAMLSLGTISQQNQERLRPPFPCAGTLQSIKCTLFFETRHGLETQYPFLEEWTSPVDTQCTEHSTPSQNRRNMVDEI